MLRNIGLSQYCSLPRDISRVLYSLQRLRVETRIFDNADIGRNVGASDEDGTIDGNSDGLECRSVELLFVAKSKCVKSMAWPPQH